MMCVIETPHEPVHKVSNVISLIIFKVEARTADLASAKQMK